MNNLEINNKKKANNSWDKLLAVAIIFMIWIGVIAIGGLLAWMFDGGQFILRAIILMPFSITAVYGTSAVLGDLL